MNIIIVEDEPVIAQRIERQSKSILDSIGSAVIPVIKWFDNLDDAQEYLSENPIELLLLDLNLHGQNGFDLLKDVCAQSFETIIISAYSEQAITAFDFGVLDFVAKPFSKERLQQALMRFVDKQGKAAKEAKKLAVKKAGTIELIDLQNVQYIKADGHYTMLCMEDGANHLHDKAIDKLEKLLAQQFLRIHRSYIVNSAFVSSVQVESGGSYHLALNTGDSLPISRSRYQTVKEMLSI